MISEKKNENNSFKDHKDKDYLVENNLQEEALFLCMK